MSGAWIRALVLILLFSAIVLVVERLLGGFLSERAATRQRNQRLEDIARGASRAEIMQRLRRHVSAVSTDLPGFLLGPAQRVERTLVMAGITSPLDRVMILLVVAPIALFLFLTMLVTIGGVSMTFGRIILLFTLAVAAGVGLPMFYFNFRANRRRRKFQEQLPVALDIFIRGLRAGHPVAAAIDLLTTELDDPMGSEFGLVADEVTYGADLTDALQAMADRWDIEDMRMFVVSLAVQIETGGNLAEILENLNKVIRDRAQLFLKVRALSSEGRISAIMLTLLPIVTFLFLFLVNPTFYLDVAGDPMFATGFIGLIGLYLIGFWMMRRMVDLKV